MPARAFPTFAEASAFARNIAQERKALVHIVRRGAQFVVESKVVLEPSKAQAPKAIRPLPGQAPALPKPARPPKSSPAPVASASERLCIECGVVIPPERVRAIPTVSRCMKCQSSLEQTHDTRRWIDEGLAGTREGHKKMRGKLLSDMRKRVRDQ
jgi:hypothetical protein